MEVVVVEVMGGLWERRSPALKWSSRPCAHHGGSRMGSKVGLGNRFACVWSRARYKGRCALTVGPVCRVGSAAAAPCGRAGVLNARKSVAVGVNTEPGAAIGASRTSRSGVPPRRGCQLTEGGRREAGRNPRAVTFCNGSPYSPIPSWWPPNNCAGVYDHQATQ